MTIDYLTIEHLDAVQLIRFFSKIVVHPDLAWNDTPCWIWIANRGRFGYGIFKWKEKSITAHRFAYAWLVASLPKGKKYGEIDHLCRRPSCCNPAHLEFVSSYVNGMRSNSAPSRNAKKTHCKYGHPFSGYNLVIKQGHRQCRICLYRLIHEYNERHPEMMVKAVKKWQQANKAHIAQWHRERNAKIKQAAKRE